MSKRCVVKGCGVLLSIAIAGCAAESPPDEATAEQAVSASAATLFGLRDFAGRSFEIVVPARGSRFVADLPASFDNITSSLIVDEFCTVTLYTDPEQSGDSQAFSGDVSRLPSNLNNAVS